MHPIGEMMWFVTFRQTFPIQLFDELSFGTHVIITLY
jgi:hypothetical protein